MYMEPSYGARSNVKKSCNNNSGMLSLHVKQSSDTNLIKQQWTSHTTKKFFFFKSIKNENTMLTKHRETERESEITHDSTFE